MQRRFIALLATLAILAAPAAALADGAAVPARSRDRVEAQASVDVHTTDRVRDRLSDGDRPPVERIEHFIRTHHWLARWIESLPCETDPCIPPRLQHWFRTHPTAAHWIFWYIRTVL